VQNLRNGDAESKIVDVEKDAMLLCVGEEECMHGQYLYIYEIACLSMTLLLLHQLLSMFHYMP
jgi:hypothetical protein